MAINPLRTGNNALKIPVPQSWQPIMYWITWTDGMLNQNITVANPTVPANPITVTIRQINVLVDLSNPDGTGISYIAENGLEYTYYPLYSGVHTFNAFGITNIADGSILKNVGV